MAKSKWKVIGQRIGNEELYIIGRLLDKDKLLISDNVEYYGGFSDDKEATQIRADHLNAMEEYEVEHADNIQC